MNIGLDTSVVLRLLIGEPVHQASAARAYLDELFIAGNKAAISDLVVSETYFALQHHYDVPKAAALSALNALFESGEIVSSDHAGRVLRETKSIATAKPGFVDRLIHASYQADMNGMATFEKKAGRLAGIIVLKAAK